jgi:hypothetical protein
MQNCGQQRVDWDALWSLEARKKQLPSLHGEAAASSATHAHAPHLLGLLHTSCSIPQTSPLALNYGFTCRPAPTIAAAKAV